MPLFTPCCLASVPRTDFSRKDHHDHSNCQTHQLFLSLLYLCDCELLDYSLKISFLGLLGHRAWLVFLPTSLLAVPSQFLIVALMPLLKIWLPAVSPFLCFPHFLSPSLGELIQAHFFLCHTLKLPDRFALPRCFSRYMSVVGFRAHGSSGSRQPAGYPADSDIFT